MSKISMDLFEDEELSSAAHQACLKAWKKMGKLSTSVEVFRVSFLDDGVDGKRATTAIKVILAEDFSPSGKILVEIYNPYYVGGEPFAMNSEKMANRILTLVKERIVLEMKIINSSLKQMQTMEEAIPDC